MTDVFISVITTIQTSTPAMQALASSLRPTGGKLLVVGDRKGPLQCDVEAAEFYSIARQENLPFQMTTVLPENHYARKNLGYLLAMQQGATVIYETDDDNAPLPGWQMREKLVEAVAVKEAAFGWVNVFRYFSDEHIWPRGFPLELVLPASEKGAVLANGPTTTISAPIQQGLANNSPDVDAIWRLLLDHPVDFREGTSIFLPAGMWCPFNSQSTWWWPEAFPLMYLPSYCSFRMTDIWRSFIAQRCLWEMGCGVVFHAPEVIQERNEHNLMRDFADEISGYTRNKEFVAILAGLSLQEGAAAGQNLLACYEALVKSDFFPEKELELVEAWLADTDKAQDSLHFQ